MRVYLIPVFYIAILDMRQSWRTVSIVIFFVVVVLFFKLSLLTDLNLTITLTLALNYSNTGKSSSQVLGLLKWVSILVLYKRLRKRIVNLVSYAWLEYLTVMRIKEYIFKHWRICLSLEHYLNRYFDKTWIKTESSGWGYGNN